MEVLFTHLAKSAGLLTVFLALYYFLLREDKSFSTNRKFLVGGLLASAILPSVYFTRKVFVEASTTPFTFIDGDFTVTEVVVQEPSITPLQILLAVYITGVAFMLGRMLLQLFSLFRVLYSGEVSKNGGINYIAITTKTAPFSFLNYIVYNPSLHSETELAHIIKHEKVHVMQWHTADVLMANLNLIYQWFNPMAWLYVRILQQNLEYIADSEAVKEAPCKKEYQKALVKISIENFNPALTNSFYQSFIKKRIVMLNKNTKPKNNFWKAGLVFPLLLAFILLFNIRTEAQIKPVQENNEEAVTSDLKVTGTITKNSTEEGFAYLKKVFEKQEVILDFENIQRDSQGVITAITIRFLNKKTNSTGVTNQNNPEGINSIVIFVTNETTGFADVPVNKENGKTPNEVLSKAGKNPLYIVNGKEYRGSDLDGKTIEIIEGFAFLSSENSSTYGEKGKDGVIIISRGKIIDNIEKELEQIDIKNNPVTKSFIQIRKGEKPMLIEVNKTSNTSTQKSKPTPSTKENSTSKSGTQDLKNIKGNPVFVLNGEKVDRSKIQSIPGASIENVTVLKGKDATSIYGKAAKDGAILVSTKSKKLVISTGVTFSTDKEDENLKLYKEMLSKPETPMVILDGNIQNKNYQLSDLNPDQIAKISITKGNEMKGTYGERAKNGVIHITTKSQNEKTFYMNQSPNFQSLKIREGNDIIATQYGTNQNTFILRNFKEDRGPLYIVDSKEMGEDYDINELDPNNITSIQVFKDKTATLKYGDKAKYGVIEVTTKNNIIKTNTSPDNLAVISSDSSNDILKITKNQLKDQANVEVTYENVERNRKGRITGITITAKFKNQSASATFQVDKGIPDIYVGVRNGSPIVSSNPPAKR